MAKAISVRRKGYDVTATEIGNDEALSRQGQVDRTGEAVRSVQRSQEVAEGRVHQDGSIY